MTAAEVAQMVQAVQSAMANQANGAAKTAVRGGTVSPYRSKGSGDVIGIIVDGGEFKPLFVSFSQLKVLLGSLAEVQRIAQQFSVTA